MSDINPYIIALGNFDGLHLGHKALLEEVFAIKKAMAEDNKKSISAVVTFYPHPLAYLKGYSPPLLLGDEEKAAFLKEYMAIDEICTLNFDEKMANSDPQSFLEQLLLEKMPACHVVIGFNFRFGYQGKGDGEFLKNFCRQHNIGISIIPAVKDDLGIISSSFIREKISQGQIEAADQMLGYWYHMAGKVVHGKQLGRTIGFHTANVLPPQNRQLPPNGVYAVRVIYHGCLYSGIANIGFRPTVEKKETLRILEVHFLCAEDLDLYGEKIDVYFGKFIRPERQFDNLEELKEQINADSLQTKCFLASIAEKSHLPKAIK